MSAELSKQFPQVHVVTHPLVAHKLAHLRAKTTNKRDFKELVHEITLFLGYEATKCLEQDFMPIDTPFETIQAKVIKGRKPVILPILRAGIGMVDAMLALMPAAKVGHLGLFRNEKTLEPEQYFFKVPQHSEGRDYFICDPMIATGGSAKAAVDAVKALGVKSITFISLVAVPEGLEILTKAHPDVPIFTASIDRGLNKEAYIVPGLGDAGDRMFGTL